MRLAQFHIDNAKGFNPSEDYTACGACYAME